MKQNEFEMIAAKLGCEGRNEELATALDTLYRLTLGAEPTFELVSADIQTGLLRFIKEDDSLDGDLFYNGSRQIDVTVVRGYADKDGFHATEEPHANKPAWLEK